MPSRGLSYRELHLCELSHFETVGFVTSPFQEEVSLHIRNFSMCYEGVGG